MENPFKDLQPALRERIHQVWVDYQNDTPLSEEDKILAKLMEDHPEYMDHWESTDFDRDYSNEKVNPFLHIQVDSIVMNQMHINEPKQTKFTYNRLREVGYTHLEAIHKIAFLIIEELHHMMTTGQKYNDKLFIYKLKQLK